MPGLMVFFARYYDQGEGTYWEHTTDANTFWNTGFKGYAVGANYAVVKKHRCYFGLL